MSETSEEELEKIMKNNMLSACPLMKNAISLMEKTIMGE